MKKFYFIQSLKSHDPSLGKDLYNIISPKATSAFYNVQDKPQLFIILQKILVELKNNLEIDAVLHFHTHGNEEGIAIFDENNDCDFLKWDDLRSILREIYISTLKKPMISICACEGFNISKLVPQLESCPYNYITGSFNPIGFSDSVNGYALFYDGIINGKDLFETIEKINNDFPNMDFACFNSDQIFKIAEDAYRNSEMTPQNIQKRRTELESIVIKEFGYINPQQKLYFDFVFSQAGTDYFMEEFRKAFYS
ncbi:hypothetical protein [Chryseobacterium sp. M5A1_1a]